MRGLVIVVFLGLVATAAAAVTGNGGNYWAAQPVATVTAGSFDFVNSRDGMPIFEAGEIGPGDTASGTVEIANEGDAPGELTLRQHDVVDTPGAGGGLLSDRMSMRIRDLSDPAQPRSVYDGALAPMPALQLGPLGPGQSRVYEFVASLPDRGTPTGAVAGDNAVQAAAVSVGYSWTAAESAPASDLSPDPGASPASESSDSQGALQLVILRIRKSIQHRRLVLWVYCGPGTCPVLARLRFRSRGPGRSHRALGSLHRQRSITGTEKLAFRLSPQLQRALLSAASDGGRTTVDVVLRNRGQAQLTARDAAQLRHLHPGARPGRR